MLAKPFSLTVDQFVNYQNLLKVRQQVIVSFVLTPTQLNFMSCFRLRVFCVERRKVYIHTSIYRFQILLQSYSPASVSQPTKPTMTPFNVYVLMRFAILVGQSGRVGKRLVHCGHTPTVIAYTYSCSHIHVTRAHPNIRKRTRSTPIFRLLSDDFGLVEREAGKKINKNRENIKERIDKTSLVLLWHTVFFLILGWRKL